jgi:hypothetical protein
MEPQEQPTKAIFSFADELQRRQQRAEEQKAVWEQKQQRAAELYRSGQNPILAYIETMKPEADPARIKRAETAAKIAAWSNMLTALGTGIVGMATEGYVPKTGTDAPLRMLDRINEWEKLYDSQNREYRQLKLRALMGQQEGQQQAANMEASAAGQAYNLAQKQYDALLGYMWKAQQEKQKRAEDLRDKKEIEKIRGENNLKVARTRAAASASTASARAAAAADKAVVQFLDRDEKTVVSLSPAQESLLYEKGRDMGIIPEDGSPTKKPAYTGEKVPQFSYGKLKPAQKAQLLRTVYLKLTGEQEPSKPPADIGLLFRQPKRYITGPYSPETLNLLETGQAEQMREAGFSDQQIMDYYLNYE